MLSPMSSDDVNLQRAILNSLQLNEPSRQHAAREAIRAGSGYIQQRRASLGSVGPSRGAPSFGPARIYFETVQNNSASRKNVCVP